MKNNYQTLLLTALLLAAGPAQADFGKGVYAYQKGEYEQAYGIMRSLSETTNDEYTGYAQYYLGMMYLNGQGIEQDYAAAAEWFRKAAEKRVKQAQYRLGRLYLEGNGLPKDYEYAYAWFRVALAYKHGRSKTALAQAKNFLSPEELTEADKLFAELISKYGPTEADLNPPDAGTSGTLGR